MDREEQPSERALRFLRRWQTDVAPVHEKTERSRRFRTEYLLLALRSLLLVNGGGLLALPLLGALLPVRLADHAALFRRAEGSYLAGTLLALVAMLLAIVMLDADVIRQKGERAATWRRLIDSGFPEAVGDSAEAERVRSERHRARFWRLGVGLMWTLMGLLALAVVAFALGSLWSVRLLASA